MIYEMAKIKIDPQSAKAFENAVKSAVPLFQSSKGCKLMRLEKVIENEGEYILRVGWETLENHTIDFRSSENFQKWRALVGGFFIDAPIVLHNATIEEFF